MLTGWQIGCSVLAVLLCLSVYVNVRLGIAYMGAFSDFKNLERQVPELMKRAYRDGEMAGNSLNMLDGLAKKETKLQESFAKVEKANQKRRGM